MQSAISFRVMRMLLLALFAIGCMWMITSMAASFASNDAGSSHRLSPIVVDEHVYRVTPDGISQPSRARKLLDSVKRSEGASPGTADDTDLLRFTDGDPDAPPDGASSTDDGQDDEDDDGSRQLDTDNQDDAADDLIPGGVNAAATPSRDSEGGDDHVSRLDDADQSSAPEQQAGPDSSSSTSALNDEVSESDSSDAAAPSSDGAPREGRSDQIVSSGNDVDDASIFDTPAPAAAPPSTALTSNVSTAGNSTGTHDQTVPSEDDDYVDESEPLLGSVPVSSEGTDGDAINPDIGSVSADGDAGLNVSSTTAEVEESVGEAAESAVIDTTDSAAPTGGDQSSTPAATAAVTEDDMKDEPPPPLDLGADDPASEDHNTTALSDGSAAAEAGSNATVTTTPVDTEHSSSATQPSDSQPVVIPSVEVSTSAVGTPAAAPDQAAQAQHQSPRVELAAANPASPTSGSSSRPAAMVNRTDAVSLNTSTSSTPLVSAELPQAPLKPSWISELPAPYRVYPWTAQDLDAVTQRSLSMAHEMRRDRKFFQEKHGHYDHTYFKQLLPYAKRVPELVQLTGHFAWLMESHDIPCWLSAGALIGYRWSGGMLPWDEDVDFQCLASDLFAMELLAQRMREEPLKLPPSMRRYRLVINPHHVIRSIRQPQNTVDGRFVDTSTGLYIDIFALQKRDSAPRTLTIHKADGSPPVVKSSDPVLYSSKAPRQTPPFVHTYTEESLFPLQPCVFEGINIQCPHDVDRVLVQHYGPSVLIKTHADRFGYLYNQTTRLFTVDPSFKPKLKSPVTQEHRRVVRTSHNPLERARAAIQSRVRSAASTAAPPSGARPRVLPPGRP